MQFICGVDVSEARTNVKQYISMKLQGNSLVFKLLEAEMH